MIRMAVAVVAFAACLASLDDSSAQHIGPQILPEQRRIAMGYAGVCPRDPRAVRSEAPNVVPPPGGPALDRPRRLLSLQEAIFIALQNSEVIRVAAGGGVSSTGQTIYDPAVTNTTVDRARSRFDPSLSVENQFSRDETPGVSAMATPPYAQFSGYPVDGYRMSAGIAKDTLIGGRAGFQVNANPTRSPNPNWPLSPNSPSSAEFSYIQPLLKDAGRSVNTAPITIRVYQTEQSFFQFKESVQQLVRSTAELYWSLVEARINVWTREQQIRSANWAAVLAEAKLEKGLGDASDLAQARVTAANLRAQLIAARSTLLTREQALRNMFGWPPHGPEELVPTTAPTTGAIPWKWDEIVATAIDNRPDLASRRLTMRIDQQELTVAENETLPDVNVNAAYRLNHLAGETPYGNFVDTAGGRYASWRLGVDLNMPIGRRDSRAVLRERQLIHARDRAKYEEALHQTSHTLANTYRNLDQSLLEYRAFQETRAAAKKNVDVQQSRWKADFTIYINVLQAIASWGDAVASESRAVLQYNSELARLQEQMGVILEENGVVLENEYFCSLGPGGRMAYQRAYPRSIQPQTGKPTEPPRVTPSEQWFELDGLDVPSLELPPRKPEAASVPLSSTEQRAPTTTVSNHVFSRSPRDVPRLTLGTP